MASLRHKLLLSYALLVVGIVVVGGWSVYHFSTLGQSVRQIMSRNYRSVIDAQQMKEALERQDSALQLDMAGQGEKAERQYETNRARFAQYFADAAGNITEVGEAELVRDIGDRFHSFTGEAQVFLREPLSVAAQRQRYFGEMEPAFLALKDRCDDLLRMNQDAMLRAQRRAEEQAARAARAAVGLALGSLLLGIFYSLNLSRALLAPLVRLTEAARRIGRGEFDLAIESRSGDEVQLLAEEFNRMAASLGQYREREAARLQVAEQEAEAAINSLYEPVLVTGPGAEVRDLNRAAEALFGPKQEWLDRPVEELGVVPLARAVRDAAAHGRTVAPEGERALAAVRVDGREQSYRLRTAPIFRRNGDPAGTVTVLEDVTRLRELDRLKDEFIGVASHELRTPLTSLQMAVYLLEEGAAGQLTDRQQQLVHGAREDCDRLTLLTRDLLDLSRLEAGSAAPDRKPITPMELVERGMEPLRGPIREKGLELRVEVPAELPPVLADGQQASRVVTNLVSNALRHTERGSITVAARQEGNQVLFSVSDTGTGVPREYLGRIFERFVQVPGSRSGGAGLGLSIARKIVEAHGGEIEAASVPGKGATFSFSLPVGGSRG